LQLPKIEFFMIRRLAWMKWLSTLIAALAAISASGALASVQVSYDILKEYPTSGMSASWVHSATLGGPDANDAYFNGLMSGRVAGSLTGLLDGDKLTDISGTVGGKLKQLSGYFLPGTYSMGDVFNLKLGEAAGAGKSGKLQFVSNGDGEFVGGWMDFSLEVSGSILKSGTLFFKPQAENSSPTLSPNRGDSAAFTLWGLNWTHESLPAVVDDTLPDYSKFLSDLDQSNSVNRPGEFETLGIALYLSNSKAQYHGNPEPTTLVIWGMLAMVGAACSRRER
jgi:hypothetical protein